MDAYPPTAENAVKLLNEALEADPVAIGQLIDMRVVCKQKLMDHPTIQIDGNRVGILGIINGIFGIHRGGPLDGQGFIAAIYDSETGKLLRFETHKKY